MNYDDWKQQTPPSFDHEEDSTCGFCGTPIKDGKHFCSRDCKVAYDND